MLPSVIHRVETRWSKANLSSGRRFKCDHKVKRTAVRSLLLPRMCSDRMQESLSVHALEHRWTPMISAGWQLLKCFPHWNKRHPLGLRCYWCHALPHPPLLHVNLSGPSGAPGIHQKTINRFRSYKWSSSVSSPLTGTLHAMHHKRNGILSHETLSPGVKIELICSQHVRLLLQQRVRHKNIAHTQDGNKWQNYSWVACVEKKQHKWAVSKLISSHKHGVNRI